MRISVKRRQPVEIQKQVIQIKLSTFVGFSLQLLCTCVQCFLHILGQEKRVRLNKLRVLLALVQILLTCVFHFKSFVIVTPRYLTLSKFSRTAPSKV